MKINIWIYILIVYTFFHVKLSAQITLTHNVGDDIINTGMFSCSEPEYFARTFTLQDFGINPGSEFEITSGAFGIYRSYGGAIARFNIYSIDNNFPDSFDELNIIGSSQFINIPWVNDSSPLIINVDFVNSVVVPGTVSRILVEIQKVDNPNEIASFTAFFSGTEFDNDFSWYKGCGGAWVGDDYLTTLETAIPKPNARFYIKVNGTDSIINVENECTGQVVDFSVNFSQTIDAILWNFGDGNTSTNENPMHAYTTAGNYTVSVNVTSGSDTINNTKNITIFESPIIDSPINLVQCDDDLDGFSVFNLTEVNAELSANHQNETITFYETQTEAEAGNSQITNITTYPNETVSTDMVWARVENSNNCYRTAQVNLLVSTTQIPNTFTRDFYKCDDGTNTIDGIATFDLNPVNAEIQALFPAGQQLIINYYRNQADALSETNPIADISNYQNIGYPNQQTIFIRVDSALNNDCLGLGQHITLYVEEKPLSTGPIIIEQCDVANDGVEAIDTSTINTELLQGQTNVSLTFTDAMGNVLSNPLPNPLITGSQAITVVMTNTASQDPDGACSEWTTIDIIIDAGVVANSISDLIVCDDDNDGQYPFDTSNIQTTLLNGQVGTTVYYNDENGNVLSSPLPNPFITETQTITAIVENPTNPMCSDETTINFIVNEQPIAYPIANDLICDDAINDGEHIYTLSDYNTQILNGQSSNIFEVNYFETFIEAENNLNPLPNSHVVNSTSEIVFARIHNSNNINCFDIISFELGVHYFPQATQPNDLQKCDDNSNDEIEIFDLSLQDSDILNGQSASENIITYHLSLTDAEADTDSISTDFPNIENPQTIYARLENSNFPECFTTTSFQIIVNEQPVLLMDELWPICEGNTVEVFADSGYDKYLWSTGEMSQSIIVDTPGTYGLIVMNIYGNLHCEASKTITVTESNIATITNIETADWTQSNNVIIVFVEGDGIYEYSLDGINYQDSNQFTNLDIDEYTVSVRDKKGCGIVTKDVYLLYYPYYFTPNGDGYHDTWQLKNSIKEPNNIVLIYDRYGKLLKTLNAFDPGWDGNYNGELMPTNDYWFVLERQNGKTYRGHFTLKR